MRILGIDPGLRLTGYACVESQADSSSGPGRHAHPALSAGLGAGDVTTLLEAGVLRLNAKSSIVERLDELDRDLHAVFDRLRPSLVAVEKLYAHYKHPTTAIIMGHARGVVLLAAHRSGARLIELAATEVKKSLTGFGHAGKEQMQEAVKFQLNLKTRPEPPDVADAIAIALCAARRAPEPAAPLLHPLPTTERSGISR